MSATLDPNALRQGGAVALLFAVPCSLIASWLADTDDSSGWAVLFVLGALAGFVLGAGVAAWLQQTGFPLVHGLVCAAATYLLAQAVFVTIKLITGGDVSWLAVLFNLTAAACAGLIGGGLGSALQKRGLAPSSGSRATEELTEE